jgi:hypothetical protein
MYAVVRVAAGGAWLLCSDGSRRRDLKFYLFIYF